MATGVLDDLKQQAKAAGAHVRARFAAIDGDVKLSPEGKRQAAEAARAEYHATIARLQALATGRVTRRKQALPELLQTAELKKSAILDGLLGETTRFALLERRVSRMTPDELVAAAADTPDDWARAVMLDLGRTLHGDDARIAEGLRQVELRTKWGADVAELEAEGRDLDSAAQDIPRLDVEGEREAFAQRMGFRVENVPTDYPF